MKIWYDNLKQQAICPNNGNTLIVPYHLHFKGDKKNSHVELDDKYMANVIEYNKLDK